MISLESLMPVRDDSRAMIQPKQLVKRPLLRAALAVLSGIALLVVALNKAAPAIVATVLAYFVLSAFTIIPYVFWRRRAGQPVGT